MLCLASATTGLAADTALPVAFMDTLTVVAPRAERHLGGVTSVTVVDLDASGGASDLASLLEEVAGLRIRRFGGLGAPALPSIRGSSASRVTVLVDGIPLNDAQDGVLDLASLPLDRFVRAEIHRGGLPAHLGGPGGAGAVNLVSRREGGRGAEMRLSAGSYGEAGGRVLLRDEFGGIRALALVHTRRADNRYPYLDVNGTFANPDDDVERERENAWFRERGASLVLGAGGVGDPGVRLSLGGFRRDGGVAGPVGATPIVHAERSLERLDAALGLTTAGGGLGVELAAVREEERLEDHEREVGWDPPGVSVGRSAHLTARVHGAWDLDLPAGLGDVSAVQVADWRRQRFEYAHAGVSDPRRERTSVVAGVDVSWTWPALRLAWLPSARWQRHEDDFPPLPPLPHLPVEELARPHVHTDWARSLAVVWEAMSGRLFLEGRRHRSERPPTWVELFGRLGFAAGNRELVPELLDERELAVRLRTEAGLGLRWAVYRSDADRAIVWVRNAQATSRAENIGASRTTGHELELTAELPGGAAWWCSLTTRDARDRGDDPIYAGKTLPHQPSWTVACGASLPAGAWTLRGRVIAEAGNWRSRYHGAEDAMPSRTVVGAGVSRRLAAVGRDLDLSAEILNLTDNDVHDDEGYPLAGRSFRLTADIR